LINTEQLGPRLFPKFVTTHVVLQTSTDFFPEVNACSNDGTADGLKNALLITFHTGHLPASCSVMLMVPLPLWFVLPLGVVRATLYLGSSMVNLQPILVD